MINKQDDELDRLEEDIRKLKSKYDQFFAGITKVPPSTDRYQIESRIHEMNKQKMRDNGRRFRFSTIQARYNQYRELWGRRMREREEGPVDFRRRKAALEAPSENPAPPPPARVTSSRADPYVKMTPGTNGETIQALFEAVEQAHQEMGKRSTLSVEQLAAMVQKQADVIREKYQVSSVAFRVETVDGKVKLKAKPLQD